MDIIWDLAANTMLFSFGALPVHTLATLLSSILCLGLWTTSSTLSSTLAFIITFGVLSGAVIGLPPASVAHILGPSHTQQQKHGQWTGMMYTVAAPFALTGPVIAGTIGGSGANKSWIGAEIWAGSCLLIASICMAISAVTLRRERRRENSGRHRNNDEEIARAANSPYLIRERMGSIGFGLWGRARSLTGSPTGLSTVVPSRMTSRRTSRRPSLDVHLEEKERDGPEEEPVGNDYDATLRTGTRDHISLSPCQQSRVD